jgi:hypothetical protein
MMECNFKVGDRVRIKGDCYDFTDHLDGCLGTVIVVDCFDDTDCLVVVDNHTVPSVPGTPWFPKAGWCIYKSNMTLVGRENA